MELKDRDEIFNLKIALLSQCVSISEELLSNLEEEEECVQILSKREDIILELKALEESLNDKTKAICTKAQETKINHYVELLMDMNEDAIRLIQKRQSELLLSMKVNKNEQKILNYTSYSQVRNDSSIFC
ncbi:MAG: hypothetical protein PHE41_08900 [Eubacteriales bacterium]|nr:hypothetical protein [Eubacteriales bacterium]